MYSITFVGKTHCSSPAGLQYEVWSNERGSLMIIDRAHHDRLLALLSSSALLNEVNLVASAGQFNTTNSSVTRDDRDIGKKKNPIKCRSKRRTWWKKLFKKIHRLIRRWQCNIRKEKYKTCSQLLWVIYLLCANALLNLIGHCPGEVYILLSLCGHLLCQPLLSEDFFNLLSSDSSV